MATVADSATPAGVGDRLVLPALTLALAYGLASAAVALGSGVLATTYAATSTAAAVADLAAGLGLVVAGGLAWSQRTGGAIGPLTILLGVVWFAPDWIGWEDGPAVVRTLAMVAAPFLLPLLAHLVAATPGGRVGGRALTAVVLLYGVTAVAAVGLALFRDPFLELHCWRNCTDNSFLVHHEDGLTDGLEAFWLRFAAVLGALVALAVIGRLLTATRAARVASWPVLAPTALAAGAESAYAVALVGDPAEDPRGGVFAVLFLVRAAAFAGVALGVAWTVLRSRRTRSAVGRLAAELGEVPRPGSLQAALRRSLGDPGLEVAYWLPGAGRYVDAEGRPVAPPAVRDGAATPIVRNGEPVALVLHDRELQAAQELEREIGAAARLAVDNERLRAEVLAQLEDLRASRARIVEAGDAARRRLERDLHDGAQQRLLALSYELRLARAAAEADGAVSLAAILRSGCDQVATALEALRDLAHGIYPAILTDAGLGPALWTLADGAELAVELGDVPGERFAEPVERAAYLVVAGGIDAVRTAGADYAAVTVERAGDILAVGVGPVAPGPYAHLVDRVGALGGSLAVEGVVLRAEIPCA